MSAIRTADLTLYGFPRAAAAPLIVFIGAGESLIGFASGPWSGLVEVNGRMRRSCGHSIRWQTV
jgi:hypothetical protein